MPCLRGNYSLNPHWLQSLRHPAPPLPALPTPLYAQKEKLFPEVRRAALRMYVNGINLRRTARLVGVAPQTVVNWIKQASEALPTRPVPAHAETVKMDELYTFVTHKKRRIN